MNAIAFPERQRRTAEELEHDAPPTSGGIIFKSAEQDDCVPPTINSEAPSMDSRIMERQ
jgi:hypothetical protein